VNPSAGVHVIMPKLYAPVKCGMLIPETSDKRVLFYLPWEGNTCVGTTDARVPLTELPTAPASDVEFIVKESVNYLRLDAEDVRRDITAAWSGIRPLVRDLTKTDTSKLSRDHVVEVDDQSGLVTIVGGKWTTCRLMAEHTVDRALQFHRQRIHAPHPCRTWFLSLHGSDLTIDSTAGSDSIASAEVNSIKASLALTRQFGLNPDDATYLVRNYGPVLATELCKLGNLEKIVPTQPVVRAELEWAVRHEMAETVADVIGHRTRLAFVDPDQTLRVLDEIVDFIGNIKEWSTERRLQEYDGAKRLLDTMRYKLE
jgi:glycerol-3-phosphate dehydrogenase